ncbi:wax ester/triacylglycerol synthase family O-acyltransferase [uncultured Nocardioides sp.]|uniref:Diacylglycerol O-acyltransferase n=1 Tax=uncultured Nocardioides sp. TaxID=198441 RepID=A0A6J4PKR9_9ACTN|nr:wax ester/triacylglycerol synthase family O-acyltransferase [uncultured Nocardioides sp.]CAA9418830.1 MAG: Wax ester synthase/acyl-CoA:diacylglycerol acyltransferase; Diacyglycerol O-acyltransferase [uncultured Nocardioides sp.]
MSERLRPRDLAFLASESPTTPMHNATLEVFDPGGSAFDYQRLVELIADRIAFVPRYRQRLRAVPARLANPVWVDDPDFDLAYHVRRSALPRPGTLDQLRELTARIVSRPLDRTRPLWEVYFVEGLEGGRVAVLSKSHQVLVDGVRTVDLGQVLLDDSPEPKSLGPDEWQAGSRPTPASLVADALTESVQDPLSVLNTVRSNVGSAVRTAEQAATVVSTVAGALSNRRPAPESPVNGVLSQQRRFVAVDTDLKAYQRIRRVHGGTVNDVILATVTGALRGWLMTRAESLGGVRRLKAMVPMSVIDDELEATSLGTQIAGHEVTLPIGEPSPVLRLHQVSYAFHGHGETGRAVGAQRLAGIAGFAPTTFHALGSRVAAQEVRRGFHLAVTNVPGPQFPLYAAGARMLQSYPVHPLLPGHALAIGVTSYDGRVFYGITADRDLVPDADVLGQCVHEALDELADSASPQRPRAPRGRSTRPPAGGGPE